MPGMISGGKKRRIGLLLKKVYPLFVNGTILYVDDEVDLRFMVSSYFRQLKYHILTAEGAEEAMRLADGARLKVIILDINLAGEDGVKLMSFLKMNHPEVPVILYTSTLHDDDAVRDMLKQGARHYLRKSGSLEELFNAVQSVWK
jgi:DNA-binding NtrC family response regulator